VRLETDHLPTVDEERRCTSDAERGAFSPIVLDSHPDATAVEIGREARHVETKSCRRGDERRASDALLIREQRVVHRPEPALLAGGDGCLMREHRVRMDAEREMLEHPLDAAVVRRHHPFHDRNRSRAERAL